MAALLLIPILVCGVIWISNHPEAKLHISTYQGWLIYLQAAKYGVIILGSVFFVLEILFPLITVDLLNWATRIDLSLSPYSITTIISDTIFSNLNSIVIIQDPKLLKSTEYFATLSAISIAITIAISDFKKTRQNNNIRQKIMRIYHDNSQIEYLLACLGDDFLSSKGQNIEDRRLAFITLDTRKFYIGIPAIISPPNESSITGSEISIFPVYSGHRNEKTLRMEILNRYDLHLDIIDNEADHCDIIAIPKDRIVSLSSFTMSIHRKIDNNMLNGSLDPTDEYLNRIDEIKRDIKKD